MHRKLICVHKSYFLICCPIWWYGNRLHVVFDVHHYINSSNQMHKTMEMSEKTTLDRLCCKQLHVNHSLNGLGDFTQSSVLLHGGYHDNQSIRAVSVSDWWKTQLAWVWFTLLRIEFSWNPIHSFHSNPRPDQMCESKTKSLSFRHWLIFP